MCRGGAGARSVLSRFGQSTGALPARPRIIMCKRSPHLQHNTSLPRSDVPVRTMKKQASMYERLKWQVSAVLIGCPGMRLHK